MNSLEKQISDILTGRHTMTSAEVIRLIKAAQSAAKAVKTSLDADKSAMRDITVMGDGLETVKQRVACTELDHDCLMIAIPRLEKHLQDLKRTERDERQKADYELLMKQRMACKRDLNELFERIPSFAQIVHKAVILEKAGRRFFVKPTSGTPVNPMDQMVSKYDTLPPLISDKMLKGLRLVASDGTELYAHVETTPSVPSTALPQKKTDKNFAAEKEGLRQAQERQIFARTILRGIEHEAATRNVSVEQVAILHGRDVAELPQVREQADGKFVTAAMEKLKTAHDKILEETS